ncbi:MAG: YCF48-related protein [Bacteroidota bacterium]|nr:YCF48-related protein [Bacteroidota bacterium]
MKTQIFTIILLINSIMTAGDWRWQNPKPQGNTLWDVAFYNEKYGYAVGDYGTILFTSDQGASWNVQYEAVTDNLRSIVLVDSVTAWIVGDNAMILHTVNGRDWNEQISGLKSNEASGLNGVFFTDKNNGWAVGDSKLIIHTTNGGTTWNTQTLPSSKPYNLTSVYFISKDEGWAVGTGGIVLHTSNGGTNWTQQSTTGTTGSTIKFISSTTGFIVGDNGTIFVTKNSGQNWSKVTSGTTYGLNDITFLSATDFWISGDNGTLLHSVNAGDSWTLEAPFTYASFYGLGQYQSGLMAVGEFGVIADKKIISTWKYLNDGMNSSINWLTFSDKLNGFGVGEYGNIVKTTDGGNTWTKIVNGVTGDSFYGADQTDKDNLWCVGDGGVLLHTSDAGKSWIQQPTYVTTTLLSISFIDQQNGWACGDLGVVLHTTDAGKTWKQQTSGVTGILYGIKFKDSKNGWIAGDNGIILHSTDGGTTWNKQISPVSSKLYSVDFVDLSNGYCAGSGGVILKTMNSGTTWSKVTVPATVDLYVVSGTSNNSLWAIGDSGVVLHGSNSGTNWTNEFSFTGYNLFGLKVYNDSSAWVSGDWGTVIATGYFSGTTDVNSHSSNNSTLAIRDYKLRQNYPNPFNPSTIINYSIAEGNIVTLKIFDVLGNEVSEPVNRFETAGSYNVRFDASNLPSGIYFYQLRAGNYVETRKMILIR